MGWYYKKENEPPPHYHDFPQYDDANNAVIGDVWQCNCGLLRKVANVAQGTDGNLIVWENLTRSDNMLERNV